MLAFIPEVTAKVEATGLVQVSQVNMQFITDKYGQHHTEKYRGQKLPKVKIIKKQLNE